AGPVDLQRVPLAGGEERTGLYGVGGPEPGLHLVADDELRLLGDGGEVALSLQLLRFTDPDDVAGVRAVGAAERAVGDLSFHVLVDADLLPDLEPLRHLLSPLVSAMTTTCSALTFCDVSVLRAMKPLSRPVGWTFSIGTTRPVERSDSVSRTTASELRTTLPCRVGYAMTTPGRISAPVKSVSRALPMSALLCEWLVYVEFEEAPERLVGLLRGDAVADLVKLFRALQAGHVGDPSVG